MLLGLGVALPRGEAALMVMVAISDTLFLSSAYES